MLFHLNIANVQRAIPDSQLIQTKKVNKNHIKKVHTLQFEKAFCRHSLRGSMTVEAAVIIPMVFMVWIACIAWTSIVNVHENVQHLLGEAVLEMSVEAGKHSENVQSIGAITTWIRTFQFENLEIGGIESVDGFDFSGSRVLEDGDTILLKTTYRIRLLRGLIPVPEIRLSNQIYTKAWTGGHTCTPDEHELSFDEQTVFIAEHGRVYHTDPMCSHIHLSIYMVDQNAIAGYDACDKCMDGSMHMGQTYYITESGDHYHSRLGCSGLKRQVDTVVGDAPLRDIVGTVTVAAIATAQQVTTGRRLRLLAFCHFCCVDASTKYRKSFSFVFML